MKTRSNISEYPSPSCKSYADLSWQDRVTIVKLYDKRFNPTTHVETESVYNSEWWAKLTGDERSAAYWTSIHPERTKKGWVDSATIKSMEFYSDVNESTALDWYESCPPHLRKQLDSEISSAPSALESLYSSELYQQVAKIWGDRPKERAEHAGEDVMTYYWLEEWTREYDRLQLIATVLKNAPRMQKERKMLSQALGLKQGGNGLPSQAEGLDTTQAATVRWLESSGETPLEYLTSVYRDDTPDVRVSDKIAAARALLDYVHRKVPATIEIKGPSSEDLADQAAIVREAGEKLALLASINKKSEKKP